MPKKFADGWKCLAIIANAAQIVGLRAFVDICNKPAKHVINTILCGHVYERMPWGTIA